MSRYNIGIRYCGGCNPAYDRSRLVAQLLRRFPEIAIQYDPERYCALWIVVNGCLTGCADSSSLPGENTYEEGMGITYKRLLVLPESWGTKWA